MRRTYEDLRAKPCAQAQVVGIQNEAAIPVGQPDPLVNDFEFIDPIAIVPDTLPSVT
jgi:hypothetical protein